MSRMKGLVHGKLLRGGIKVRGILAKGRPGWSDVKSGGFSLI